MTKSMNSCSSIVSDGRSSNIAETSSTNGRLDGSAIVTRPKMDILLNTEMKGGPGALSSHANTSPSSDEEYLEDDMSVKLSSIHTHTQTHTHKRSTANMYKKQTHSHNHTNSHSQPQLGTIKENRVLENISDVNILKNTDNQSTYTQQCNTESDTICSVSSQALKQPTIRVWSAHTTTHTQPTQPCVLKYKKIPSNAPTSNDQNGNNVTNKVAQRSYLTESTNEPSSQLKPKRLAIHYSRPTQSESSSMKTSPRTHTDGHTHSPLPLVSSEIDMSHAHPHTLSHAHGHTVPHAHTLSHAHTHTHAHTPTSQYPLPPPPFTTYTPSDVPHSLTLSLPHSPPLPPPHKLTDTSTLPAHNHTHPQTHTHSCSHVTTDTPTNTHRHSHNHKLDANSTDVKLNVQAGTDTDTHPQNTNFSKRILKTLKHWSSKLVNKVVERGNSNNVHRILLVSTPGVSEESNDTCTYSLPHTPHSPHDTNTHTHTQTPTETHTHTYFNLDDLHDEDTQKDVQIDIHSYTHTRIHNQCLRLVALGRNSAEFRVLFFVIASALFCMLLFAISFLISRAIS